MAAQAVAAAMAQAARELPESVTMEEAERQVHQQAAVVVEQVQQAVMRRPEMSAGPVEPD